jgi:hypothetical protein
MEELDILKHINKAKVPEGHFQKVLDEIKARKEKFSRTKSFMILGSMTVFFALTVFSVNQHSNQTERENITEYNDSYSHYLYHE